MAEFLYSLGIHNPELVIAIAGSGLFILFLMFTILGIAEWIARRRLLQD